MSVKLLCVGDMHLGRLPSHLPERLSEEWSVDLAAARPTAVWRQVVEQACALEADAVLLAGDVVDRENRQYEALGPLEAGVRKLVENGIGVVGVVGNHDVETLPRLADQIAGFNLLGRGGKWQVASVKEKVRLVGWSFPEAVVRASPLSTFSTVRDELRDGDGPVIGLLHCDLDASGSRSAPVRRSELDDPAVSAWFLGHIHKPSSLSEQSRPVGYLGSLVPLDPTETGLRGSWLCEITDDQLQVRQLQAGPLRWEQCDVDVEGLQTLDGLTERVMEGITALQGRIGPALEGAKMVGCRVSLTGSTPLRQQLRGAVDKLQMSDLVRALGGVCYFVDEVDLTRVRSPLPLSDLAEGASYPALLARRLLQLHADDPAVEPLISRAQVRLQAKAGAYPWTLGGELEIDRAVARDYLLRAGLDALEELLSQQQASYQSLLGQS